jgi:hypothetical protein
MSEEAVQQAEAAEETEAKPTITIAEKEGENPPAEDATPTITIAEAQQPEAPAEPEDLHYQAVEKEGTVTAIWEMQGQKHVRTIDPRSGEGKQILALFETAA